MAKDDNPFGAEPPSTDAFGRPIPRSDDPFAAPEPAPTGSAPPPPTSPADDPWRTAPAPPPSGDYAAPPAPGRKAEGAVAALVLGIIGIVFCPLCAPVAWALGRKAERLVDGSGGTLGGRGEATAGKVLGIIGTVLIVIGVVLLIGLIALGSSIDGGSSTTTTFQS
jgi:hypothetical protein